MSWNRTQVEEICHECKTRINNGAALDLMCRLASEEPPNDPRHLTDTRTRVSTLLEYALGYELNQILGERGDGSWLSCVLWNVFPDLLIRGADGEVVGGLEVKALHTAAEEKSANLSTPLSKIRATGDYLVIMNWGWERNEKGGSEARHPEIYSIDVFDAHLLARIRDFTWLKNDAGRTKGIDCSTPVISVEGQAGFLKAEEGNLGKLMRIRLDGDLPPDFPERERLTIEAERFKAFQDRVIGMGLMTVFKEVCFGVGGKNIVVDELAGYPNEPTRIGHCDLEAGGKFSLWAGNRLQSRLGALPGADGDAIIWLGSKLAWKIFIYTNGNWTSCQEGAKAENCIAQIDDVIRNQNLA